MFLLYIIFVLNPFSGLVGKDYKREMMVMVINVANCALGSECLVVVVVLLYFIVTGKAVGDDPELNGLLAAVGRDRNVGTPDHSRSLRTGTDNGREYRNVFRRRNFPLAPN
jgi:hypothetical protein